MEQILLDLRYAVRTLLKAPAFTIAAALTLALGIGATSAIFSIIEAVVLRALPYRDPGRLVLISDADNRENGGFLYKDPSLTALRTPMKAPAPPEPRPLFFRAG